MIRSSLIVAAVLSLSACTYPPNVLVAIPAPVPAAEPAVWVEGGAFASGPWTTQSDGPVLGPHMASGVPLGRGFGLIASGGLGSDGLTEGPSEALSQRNVEVGLTYAVVRSDVRLTVAAGGGLGRVSDRVGRDLVAQQRRAFAQVSIGREEVRRFIPFTPIYASGGLLLRAEVLGLHGIREGDRVTPEADVSTVVLQPAVYIDSRDGDLTWSVQVGGAVTLKSLWPDYVLGGMYVAPSVRYHF